MIATLSASWFDLKTFIDQRKVICQWASLNGSYHVYASDSGFGLSCLLSQDGSAAADVLDFETNYKAAGNKSPAQGLVITATPAFAAKTIGTKKLYKRVHGIKQALTVGINTILFTIPYPWVKITDLEIVGGETLDDVSLCVLDTATGTYSTVANSMLDQFGFSVNVASGCYRYTSEFDADFYQNMQIKIVYNSISAKNVGINFILNEVK